MTQEPQKNNAVLVVIAIIGVVGTIVATTIGVIGNYNIEKIRQQAELTKIALISIATQGGATQVSMANTISAPVLTSTPYPTNELQPTYTAYPTYTLPPQPTIPPLPSQTPTQVVTLPFQDSFDLRPRPEWDTIIGNWRVVNGHLIGETGNAGRQMILVGDENWQNYTISVVVFYGGEVEIITRATDDGYLALKYNCGFFSWVLVQGGNSKELAKYEKNCSTYNLDEQHTYTVKVVDDIFTAYVDGQQYLQVQDGTLRRGRVGLAFLSYYDVWFDDFSVEEIQ